MNSMAQKNTKGLGRGLDALFALPPRTPQNTATDVEMPAALALDCMAPGPWQPRTRMDEAALHALAQSIRAQGIMQPVLVRPRAAAPPPDAPPYEIIAGERRWRAARMAGLAQVPVLVRQVSDQTAAAMALIENIQREDLNPIEEAQGLARLVQEFGLTHEQAAHAVGRSRSAASNLLRLLNLSEPVQQLLLQGALDMGHARALLALDAAQQVGAAQHIAQRQLSVRAAEQLVRQIAAAPRKTAKQAHGKPRDIARVEEELADLLMAQVDIRIKKSTPANRRDMAGEIAIEFGSLDALNGLIERLRSTAG